MMSSTEAEPEKSPSGAATAVQVLIGLVVGGAAVLAISALATFGLGADGDRDESPWILVIALSIAAIAGFGAVAALRYPTLMTTAGSVLLLTGLIGLAFPRPDSGVVDSMWSLIQLGSWTFLLVGIGGAAIGAGIAGIVLARR
jgi:hypothetical protein